MFQRSVTPSMSGCAASTRQPRRESRATARSQAARTDFWSGIPPRSGDQATRSPGSGAGVSGKRRLSPGSATDVGSRGSGPAMAAIIAAVSRTVRVIGPLMLSVSQAASFGYCGTRPGELRKATSPQKLAGTRSEPPKSLPIAPAHRPAATAAAEPPLEPARRLPEVVGVLAAVPPACWT